MPSRFTVALSIGCIATASLHAQSARAAQQPKYTKVLELDSAFIESPTMSPDGRWIAFTADHENVDGRSVWVVPAAGGKPTRVTTGDYTDRFLSWFPSSDRLVFRSSRVGNALMTVTIDPKSGRATEPPQRLTLEVPGGHFAASPDGRWVVYQTVDERGGLLRIIPSTGGTPRTLDSVGVRKGGLISPGFTSPVFTTDGRSVEYVHIDEARRQSVRRVSVTGGPSSTIVKSAERWAMLPSMLTVSNAGVIAEVRPGRDTVTLRDFSGNTIGRVAPTASLVTNAPATGFRFTNQRNAMLVATHSNSTEVRIIPSTGGVPRAVRPGSTAEDIDGMLADGRIALEGRQGARPTVDLVPLNGGRTTRIALPDSAHIAFITIDGKTVYWRAGKMLAAFDVATKSSRVISRDFVSIADQNWLSTSATDDVMYADRVGQKLELRLWSPTTGASRIIKAIPATATTHTAFQRRGALVTYSVSSGDSTNVFLLHLSTGAVQRVVGVRGKHTDGIAISPDARHLAFGIQVITGTDTSHAVAFADLGAEGTVVGQPRLVATGNLSGVAWLPDGKDIVYLSIGKSVAGNKMMRLSSEEGAVPRILNEKENAGFWSFQLSFDGKWIAYPVELANHATIWRVDFPTLDGK